MRNIIHIVLVWFLIAGCGREDGPVNPDPGPDPGPTPEDIFELDCKSKTVSYTGESFSINVRSSGSWKMKADKEWIIPENESHEGSEIVTIKIAASYEREERKGHLSFIKDLDTLKLEIIQEARPFIELSQDDISVDGDGGTFDVLFLSSTPVSISNHNEWIRLINISPRNILSFEVLRNNSDAREGNITIICETDSNISKVLKVHQGEKIPHPSVSFEEGTQMNIVDSSNFILHPVFVDMTDTYLIWSSSDSETAGVDNRGNVTVHKTGTCRISAHNVHHNVEASITLDIKLKAQKMSIMFGNQDVMNVPISSRFTGEKIPVVVTLSPAYAYADDLVFYSSNSEVAEFESNTLHCLKSGKSEIYVESAFNDIYFKFTVIVIDAEN